MDLEDPHRRQACQLKDPRRDVRASETTLILPLLRSMGVGLNTQLQWINHGLPELDTIISHQL